MMFSPLAIAKPKLDPALYSITSDELQFFQKLTDIDDPDAVKQHVIDVQSKAYEIYGYPCIRRFSFIKLKIAGIPGYKLALKLLQERKDPILLDIGCCFGNDVRKAFIDGWPVQNLIASDLRQCFWDYGHELYKSTPQSFPAAFIVGDVFSQDFITMPPIPTPSSSPLPPLTSLTSLTPLQRKVSAIHASAFFHLFSEQGQLEIAKRLSSLLLLKRGSVIFGAHGSLPTKGYRKALSAYRVAEGVPPESDDAKMFCHCPESWRDMWVNDVFGMGKGGEGEGVEVRVHAEIVESRRELHGTTELDYIMHWCVEIL